MALGKPPIVTPRVLDVRAVQGTVNNIRERLQFIEQAITALTSQAASSQTAANIQTLQIQLAQLTTRLSAVEAAVGAADIVELSAGETVVAGEAVVPDGVNGCAPADLADPLAVYAVIGVATNSAGPGQPVSVQRRGNYSVLGANFDVGQAVYVTTGGLTQYPTYDPVAIPIGVATTSTTFWVSPAWPSLRTLGFDPGYEDFIPATTGLVRDAVLLTEDFNDAGAGIIVKTGENDVTARTLTGTAARVAVSNGSGTGGNPTVDIDAAYAGQTSITTLGTVATGVWAGTTVAANHGGTGVANAVGSTITLGGPLTTAGSFASTFTMTGVTSVTFPTTGTLATTSQLASGANPTASVGLAAVNGAASTFMRSDAAPALDVSISPTWTGSHAFNNTITGSVSGNAATATALQTARNINGVAFDGTANVTVAAAAGTLTGATLAAGVTASSLTSVGTLTSLTTSGNVGVGGAPTTRLDVQGSTPFVRLKEATTGYLGFRGQNDSGNFYVGIDNSAGGFYGTAYARVLYADGAYPLIFYTNAVARGQFDSGGQFLIQTLGKGISVKEGSNAKMGTATLVAGTVVVSTTAVTANSRIFITRSTTGGTAGHLSYTISAGASFTVNSSSATETSTFNWLIFEPS